MKDEDKVWFKIMMILELLQIVNSRRNELKGGFIREFNELKVAS
jgi:hypothetical protein